MGLSQQKIDANLRLKDLIDFAYEKTGKQVVVLIDEYDAPLLDVAHEKEQLDELRNIMRNFFSPLKCEKASFALSSSLVSQNSRNSAFSAN